MAMTGPRVSTGVDSGGGRGGEIFSRTLSLFMYGIDMIIASTPLCRWCGAGPIVLALSEIGDAPWEVGP